MGIILLILFSLTSFQVKAIVVGDILLQPLKCWACVLIEQEEDSEFSHIGIYIGDGMVAEAFGDRVKVVTLNQFLAKTKPGAKVRVKRSIAAVEKIQLLESVAKYLGRNYDGGFLWDDNELYCSEFLYHVLLDILPNIDLGPQPMLFNVNPEHWDRYFRGETPRGELGISPEDFNLSFDFVFVEEL